MRDELKKLYALFGFRFEREEKNCLCFSLRSGFYLNAEIVQLENSSTCKKAREKLEEEYEKAGVKTITFRYYEKYADAERYLFEEFFYIQQSRDRLLGEYRDFCDKQSNRLLSEYSYIPCQYSTSGSNTDIDLVNRIVNNIRSDTARLTILEAAAGYGKTCTVYEILNRLVETCKGKIPLFIELAKNRTAPLFRYVLQNEINEKYSHLSEEVVVYEIRNGNIPLIIDGFDELIQWKKSLDRGDNVDEQSVSMLTTIADLLGENSKAWILLTSRRSAIFTGDIFEEWVASKLNDSCTVERYQILKPTIQDWIGEEKYNCLKGKGQFIDNISNPVLLTWIRNQSIGALQNLNAESMLSAYFDMMLGREETRQLLNLPVERLFMIMQGLAAEFARYDIIADGRNSIEELLYDILKDDLMKYRQEHMRSFGNQVGMLSNSDYVERILNNSLLDRISSTRNEIGFINEFVLGILVGNAICLGDLSIEDLSDRFVDIATTAYASRTLEKRRELYIRVKEALLSYNDQCRLLAELNLLQKNDSQYTNAYFSNIYFSAGYTFDSTYTFDNCTFSECIFTDCEIDASVFKDDKFFNCRFYNIKVKGAMANNIFLGCEGYEPLQCEVNDMSQREYIGDKYEKMVLEQFWKPGYSTAEPRRTYTALFKGLGTKDQAHIESALKALLKRDILKELNVCYELNTSKMKEIREILGRLEIES